AAISAAVVETLNVGRPPPVPAVSIRSSRLVCTGLASRRIVVASPTSSSTVSPFVRSAISTAAVCTSEALPSMISARTAADWSALRSRREASASIASVRISLPKEVLQQTLAVRGQDGLGVELDAERGQVAVAHGHHDAAAAGGDDQGLRELRVGDEGVIATDGQRARQAREDALAVVLDLGRLAVHRHVADDLAAERLHQRLVTEADAQRRDPGLGKAA